MKNEQQGNARPREANEHPGDESTAQNPNLRANENIRRVGNKTGTESADIEDEVGTEITDGEDA